MNTRKDNNGQALKKWRAAKPGHVAKPLRFIGDKTNERTLDGKLIVSPQYRAALSAARRGDGLSVQKMARAYL